MFVFSAFNAFKIKGRGLVTVNFSDNMGILLPKNKVLQHIMAFWRNDSFYLNLIYAGDPNTEASDLVTPRMIEDYMKEINEGEILDKCRDQMEANVASRQRIIKDAVDFMIATFGDGVDVFQRKMTAHALVKLFPFLGIRNSQKVGIVSRKFLEFVDAVKLHFFFHFLF